MSPIYQAKINSVSCLCIVWSVSWTVVFRPLRPNGAGKKRFPIEGNNRDDVDKLSSSCLDIFVPRLRQVKIGLNRATSFTPKIIHAHNPLSSPNSNSSWTRLFKLCQATQLVHKCLLKDHLKRTVSSFKCLHRKSSPYYCDALSLTFSLIVLLF